MKTHFFEIQAHSKDVFPDECCGAMLGTVHLETAEKHVLELIRLDNHSTENKRRRFKVTDADYQFVENDAKKKGIQLLGFYHSHPNQPAIPSDTDLTYAWPFFSYIIQSIVDHNPKELLSYELDLNTARFLEETVNIVD